MAWAPDYVTRAEIKNFARVTTTVDDTEIDVVATGASRAVDRHCHRQFGKVDAPEERLYTPWYDCDKGRWVIDIDDLMSTAGLVISIVDIGALTDYVLEPVNAAAEGKPWTRLAVKSTSAVLPTGVEHEAAITASWGWSAVPVPVKLATRLQCSRFLARRESPYGVAGSPEAGSEMRLLSKLDPDVAVSLVDFVRPGRVG